MKKKAISTNQVIKFIAEKNGLTQKKTRDFFASLSDLLTQQIVKNGKIIIPEIAIIKYELGKSRLCKTPTSMHVVQTPPKKRLKILFLKEFRTSIQEKNNEM